MAGRVLTDQGVGLLGGRIVAVAPRSLTTDRAIRREATFADDGSFRLMLPAADWTGHVSFAAIYDTLGLVVESGLVRIGEGLLISVKAHSHKEWYMSGTLELAGAPTKVEGWLALYVDGGLQPLAECQFTGRLSEVRLRFNLAQDWEHSGGVSLHVFAPGLQKFKVLPFPSLESFRQALASGLSIAAPATTLMIPLLPNGGHANRIQIAQIHEGFLSTEWHQLVEDSVEVILGSAKYKVAAEHGDLSVVGVVDPLGAGLATARWLIETPGPHVQGVLVVDEDGRAVAGARLAAALLMPDADLSGLFSTTAVADVDGRVSIGGLPQGEYALKVRHPAAIGYPSVSGRVSVPSPDHRLVVPRPTQIWVEPICPGGPDLIGQFLTYWRRRADPERRWHRKEVSAKLGRAVVQGLPRGDYELYVWMEPHLGYANVSIESGETPQVIAVDCPIPSGISGQLLSAAGLPISGRWVSTTTERGEAQPAGFEWNRARSDGDGRFWVCGEGAPSRSIVVWDATGTHVARTVDISSVNLIRLDD